MAIETQVNKVQYVGNGVTTVFPVTFPVQDRDHLRLYLWAGNQQSKLEDGFTITGLGTNAINVVMDAPLPTGVKLTIMRIVPLKQLLDLTLGGSFDPDVLESALDNIVMQIQQLEEKTERALVAPESMNEGEVSYEGLVDLNNQSVQARNEAQAAAATAINAAGNAADAVVGQLETYLNQAQEAAGSAGTDAARSEDAAERAEAALGQIVEGGVPRASDEEVKAGTVSNKYVAPDSLKKHYPQRGEIIDLHDYNEESNLVNANSYFDEPVLLLITHPTSGNFPVTERPVFFKVEPDQNHINITQHAWSATSDLYMRNGTVNRTDPENPVATWGEWRTVVTVPESSGGGFNTRRVIAASGTFTAPVTGWYEVMCIGGGNAGGVGTLNYSTAGGGGAGEVVEDFIYLEKGQTISVTIGSGNGGTTSFGTKLTARGGGIGGNGSTSQAGIAGTGYPAGESGRVASTGINTCGPNGGDNGTPYGGGGGGGSSSNTANTGGRPGGNGTAASGTARGNGGPGAVILKFNDPDKG